MLDSKSCLYYSLCTLETIADFGDNLSPKTATVAVFGDSRRNRRLVYSLQCGQGFRGNEPADEAAKSAFGSKSQLWSVLPLTCTSIWLITARDSPVEWGGCASNKLHSVKPTLGYLNVSHLSRRGAVILRRLSNWPHSIILSFVSPRSRRLTTMHLLSFCDSALIACCTYISSSNVISTIFKVEILFCQNSQRLIWNFDTTPLKILVSTVTFKLV